MKERQINKSRAIYYSLLSRFFVYFTEYEKYPELLRMIDILKENPLNSEVAQALEALSNTLSQTSQALLVEEYDDIFQNPESKNIRMTASFYDEQVESGQKRVQMLEFLAKTRIRRDEKQFTEYEDSLGFICAVMSELATLVSEGNKQYQTVQHCIFADILNEFVDEISKEIYEHPGARIFKEVIVILHSFMTFERLYLEVSPVKKIEKNAEVTKDSCEVISEEEAARRARNKAAKAAGEKNQSCDLFVAYDVESDV